MKRRSKSEQLYDQLKRDIQSGLYPVGSRLAPENEFADALAVSRWSLRPALARLEHEGLIARSQKSGTTICRRNAHAPLTLLLPCPEHLLQGSFCSIRTIMQIFSGLMAAAAHSGCRVETLPVTVDNHPEHLDWPRLDSLNENSRVVVCGFWYEHLFHFLLERGCRVCFLDEMTSRHQQYRDVLCHWQVFEEQANRAIRSVVDHLYRQGCRRIAFASAFLTEPEQPSVVGFWQSMIHHQLTPLCMEFLPYAETDESLRRKIQDFHQRSHFDALIIECLELVRPHSGLNFKEHLGIPEDVCLVTLGDCEENAQCGISGYEMQFRLAGHRMAQLLAAPDFHPGRQMVEADFNWRASSLRDIKLELASKTQKQEKEFKS